MGECDYETYWHGKELSKEQLCCLILGVRPSEIKRTEFDKNDLIDTINRDEQSVDNLDLHKLIETPFAGNKATFLNAAYESHVQFDIKFAEYLRSIKEMPRDENLEKYKNHSLFLSDEVIPQTEQDAWSFFLGFKHDYLARYVELSTKCEQGDYIKIFVGFPADDKYFFDEFRIFLKEKYGTLGARAYVKIINEPKQRVRWEDSFSKYCMDAYNHGFIFSNDQISLLTSWKIDLEYSEGSWAKTFYQEWVTKGLWTLEEASALYRGSNPTGGREFVGFGDNREVYGRDLVGLNYFRTAGNRDYKKLDTFIQDHVDAKNLWAYGESKKFKPKEITSFFLEHFPRTYKPQALLDVLGIQGRDIPTLATTSTTITPEGECANIPSSDIMPTVRNKQSNHIIIEQAFKAIISNNAEITKVTASLILDELEANKKTYEDLDLSTDDNIDSTGFYWIKCDGKTTKMASKTISNFLGRLNKRRNNDSS